MLGFNWLFCVPFLSLGLPTAHDCFDLVKKLDSPKAGERERFQKQLRDRSDAIWAVIWGSQRQNLDIAIPCLEILEEWKWRMQLSKIVQESGDDFDRYINLLLNTPFQDLECFAKASAHGRAFDRYFIRKSERDTSKYSKLFAPLSADGRGLATPFHDFSWYVEKIRPTPFKGFLRDPPVQGGMYLAKCDGVKKEMLFRSIILSDGNVDLKSASSCIIVSGGDVSIARDVAGSLIVAAGDVQLKAHADCAVVVAGGTVLVERETTNILFVSPRQIELAFRGKILSPALVFDGKSRPAPELFTFPDLWQDHGLAATLERGHVRITKAKTNAPFSHLIQHDDVILGCEKKKIESVGQFRRLLRHSLDTGQFEFDVERAGKTMTVRAPLNKPGR